MNQEHIKMAKRGIEYGRYKNQKPLLIILMGLPGTGKSYVSQYLNQHYSFTVLSGENITYSIFGTEKCTGSQYKEAYEILRFLAVDLLKQKYSVVIDGTNLKHEFRKQIYQSIGDLAKVILIYLYIDDAIALKRANSRKEDYSDLKTISSKCSPETFTAFKNQLELPQEDEKCYQLKSDGSIFEKVDVVIGGAIKELDQFVSVIVPTYKRFNMFLNCIKSLANQDYNKENYEVIGIYDGLDCDYDENKIKECTKKIKKFRFERVSHRGVAMIRNYGIELSKGNLILMVDDDCEAKSNWITSFVQYMNNRQDVVGSGGTVLSISPQTFVQKYIDFKNLLRKPIRDINGNIIALITANACFRKTALEKVGGFNEKLKNYGGEDLDLSFRCRKIGKLEYCENAIVYHNHRKSINDLVKQHIFYGRGAYLACKLNNIDFKLLKFYEPTFLNLFRYSGYVFKRIFTVSLPEFKKKNLKLPLYFPYAFLDIIRKLSFMIGATLEYYKK
ncbi:MAG: hypothetical protein C0412_18740 [Flavobacterium sp.]|nr:hypothetical protein [Flavobacterium sp.]